TVRLIEQRLDHEVWRRDDRPAPVPPVCADEIEGHRGADTNDTDRNALEELVRADGPHEPVDAQAPRLEVADRHATAPPWDTNKRGPGTRAPARCRDSPVDLRARHARYQHRLRRLRSDEASRIVPDTPPRMHRGACLRQPPTLEPRPLDAGVTDINQK